MLPGTAVLPAKEQAVMPPLSTLRPPRGGAFISNYGPETLGSTIPKGTLMGRVSNPHTFEVEEEVFATYQDTLMVVNREEYSRCAPGDYGFMVVDGSTATTLAK